MSDPRTRGARWWAMTLGAPVLGLALLFDLITARVDAMDPNAALAHSPAGAIWTATGNGDRQGTAP